jgi:adenylylsulfate kinase-like enzyme
MPILVIITGPIAAGTKTVADLLAEHCVSTGRTVVIADVDDVAAMPSSYSARPGEKDSRIRRTPDSAAT